MVILIKTNNFKQTVKQLKPDYYYQPCVRCYFIKKKRGFAAWRNTKSRELFKKEKNKMKRVSISELYRQGYASKGIGSYISITSNNPLGTLERLGVKYYGGQESVSKSYGRLHSPVIRTIMRGIDVTIWPD